MKLKGMTKHCPDCKKKMAKKGKQWYFCINCFHYVIDHGNGMYWKKKLEVFHKKCLDNCIHYQGVLNCNVYAIAFIKGCDKYKKGKTRQTKITSHVKEVII